MTSAYCLTCNEQVTETPAGTCPQGHTVSSRAEGPQPWVGHAGGGRPTQTETVEPTWRDVDLAELQESAVGTNHGNGHANGSATNGHANGGLVNGSATHGTATDGVAHAREPANGAASDELAAMLAEALSGATLPAIDDTPAPDMPVQGTPLEDLAPAVDEFPAAVPPPALDHADPAPAQDLGDDRGWDDLATLAAELQLDDRGEDTGPQAAPTPAPGPEPEDRSRSAVEDLAMSLGLDLSDGAAADPVTPPVPAAPPVDFTPPPPPVNTPPPPPVFDAPPPPAFEAPAPTPPPPPPAPVEPAPLHEPAPPMPAPAEEAPTADRIDLTNFTAGGRRVGGR